MLGTSENVTGSMTRMLKRSLSALFWMGPARKIAKCGIATPFVMNAVSSKSRRRYVSAIAVPMKRMDVLTNIR